MRNIQLYISKLITTGSTLLFNVYLAHVADVELFGVFSLFLNLIFIFNLVNEWGLPFYAPVELSRKAPEEKLSFLKEVFNFRVVITCVTLVGYGIMMTFYFKYLKMLSAGFIVIFINLFNVDWVLRSYGFFKIVAIRQVMNAVLNLLFIIAIYYLQLDILFVFVSYAAALSLSFAVGISYLIKKRIILFSFFLLQNIKSDFLHTLKRSKNVFGGFFLFNLLYTVNIVWLTTFSSEYAASHYAGYYTLFSSVIAVVGIAQEIYLSRYREDQDKASTQFSKLILIGALCIMVVLAGSPFYFHFIYPDTFKIDHFTVILVSILGVCYSYRIIYVNRQMVISNYRFYFLINLFGLIGHSLITLLFIVRGAYNENVAFLSLIVVELILVFLCQESIRNKQLGYHILAVTILCLYHMIFFEQPITFVLYSLIFLITAFVFVRRLHKIFLPNESA
jgi:O-antigen/teichoic acid export membrane protein